MSSSWRRTESRRHVVTGEYLAGCTTHETGRIVTAVPRRPTRTVPTVIVCGWEGSGPQHWQRWLAQQLTDAGREVRFVDLPDVDHPRLHPWLEALGASLHGLPEDGYDVVCHSLGSILWLHHVSSDPQTPRPARVALVAPPTPDYDTLTTVIASADGVANPDEIATFYPVPADIDTVRAGADGTVLVGSDNDPFCPEGIDVAYARPLKMAVTLIKDRPIEGAVNGDSTAQPTGAAHLNSESGFGPWPAMLNWCGRDNLAFFE